MVILILAGIFILTVGIVEEQFFFETFGYRDTWNNNYGQVRDNKLGGAI